MSDSSLTTHEQAVLQQAKAIIADRLARGLRIERATDAIDVITMELTNLDQEEFGCLFLDTRNRIICFEVLFYGTINRSSVYPRVVAKRALDLHAVAVILCHNHPSGDPAPSEADVSLTKQLIDVLKLFDVTVLDHIVVGGTRTYSLAEHGLV